jgi:hypothetical protein
VLNCSQSKTKDPQLALITFPEHFPKPGTREEGIEAGKAQMTGFNGNLELSSFVDLMMILLLASKIN